MPDETRKNLGAVLAGLYPVHADQTRKLEEAQISASSVTFTGKAINDWAEILREAARHNKQDAIIEVALKEYPENPALQQAKAGIRTVEAPRVEDEAWRGKLSDSVEKIMGKQSTLLPIAFLEQGLKTARSVVRIELPSGASGSGFLLDNNVIVTNHHVLPDSDVAKTAKVQFNFQKNAAGLDLPAASFDLNPEAGFATSPFSDPVRHDHYDWTLVRLAGHANPEWGKLEFASKPAEADDRVNIIQHPAGGPKQVALYHNVVAFADDNIVQYLTDTLPGSSGSPVFNQKWQVVALHHSGGWIREPGTDLQVYRNEGINIGRIAEGLAALA